MRVYVLLFNAGTENEGIHTLQYGDRNKILLFQDEDDALRFALMLEAQDFPPATVESIEEEEVIDFCREADYDWELVIPGDLLIPPEQNVDSLDWDQNNPPSANDDGQSEFSQDELDRLRRRFEGLL